MHTQEQRLADHGDEMRFWKHAKPLPIDRDYDPADWHDDQHSDRTGSDSRYTEVCWKCARDWEQYMDAHPEEWVVFGSVVLAMPPSEVAPLTVTK